jgi:hypothetical protein
MPVTDARAGHSCCPDVILLNPKRRMNLKKKKKKREAWRLFFSAQCSPSRMRAGIDVGICQSTLDCFLQRCQMTFQDVFGPRLQQLSNEVAALTADVTQHYKSTL